MQSREVCFLLTQIRFILPFLSLQTQKYKFTYYTKKVTILHMAKTNVNRYSQCIAPKTLCEWIMADVSLTLAYYFSIFFSLLMCIVFVRNDIPNILFAFKHIDIVYACIVLSCIVRRFTLCSSLFGFVFPFQFFNIYRPRNNS